MVAIRRNPSTNDGVWSGLRGATEPSGTTGTSGATAEQELHLAAAPWPLFVMAAETSVVQLHRQAALDLWLVTFVEGPDQLIVAASGPWAQEAPPGTVVPWAQSFCIQMVSGRGPAVAPRVHEVPAYAAAAAANDRAPHVGA